MRNYKIDKRQALLAVFLVSAAILVPTCVIAVQGSREVDLGGREARAEKAVSAVPAERAENLIADAEPGEDKKRQSVVLEICRDIYAGNFGAAREMLGDPNLPANGVIGQLRQVVYEQEKLSQRREKNRIEAYEEQIVELEKLKAEADVNGLEAEPNQVTEILSVVVKARNYADETQKVEILKRSFVEKTVEKALELGATYEQEGQWLDALINCYSWLEALYEDNQHWKDYAEKLRERAIIKASLQDNPCETAIERHEGIKKSMFVRGIKTLDNNYVTPVNFTEMADKMLVHCKNLGEVIARFDSNESISFNNEASRVETYLSGIKSIKSELDSAFFGVNRDKFLDIFDRLFSLNNATIGLTDEVFIAQACEGALGALDPYTQMVWPWQIQDFQKSMTNEFTGVGIEINKADGPLKVSSLLPDTPAYKSGLDAGDIIVKVDGEPTKDMTLHCAVRKITGPKGTPVTLTVRGEDEEETRDITIVRDRIVVPTIRGQARSEEGEWRNMIDPDHKIGYLRITSFSETTSKDLEEKIRELEKEGMRGLVLDLRYNSGGYLSAAVEVVDMFVEQGTIVSTRPRFGAFPSWEVAEKEGTHSSMPLAILINGGSASASEIVAGALQDQVHKRAILVGTRSFGKGSVQTIVGTPGGGAQLKYTMAYYYLPSGQRVKNRYEREKLNKEDWGVPPNVEVDLTSKEIQTMLDVQRDNDILFKKDHIRDEENDRLHTLEETIESDPQLETALLLIRAKFAEMELTSNPKFY